MRGNACRLYHKKLRPTSRRSRIIGSTWDVRLSRKSTHPTYGKNITYIHGGHTKVSSGCATELRRRCRFLFYMYTHSYDLVADAQICTYQHMAIDDHVRMEEYGMLPYQLLTSHIGFKRLCLMTTWPPRMCTT